jgi:outer membrane protein TolC
MSTSDLIDAALQAQADFDDARTRSAAAAAQLKAAEQALTLANQALHDDLAANGPCVTIDDTQTPPVITLYEAVDPSSWESTVLRVAA